MLERYSFQEVMRQWGRYCKGYTENHNDDCDGCPFEINGSCNSYAKDNAQHAEQIEKYIMSWAAEYPEPIYPTWFEVLEDMGVAGRINGEPYYDSMDRETYLKVSAFTPKAFKPIPTDIAEKLGIKPKEAK